MLTRHISTETRDENIIELSISPYLRYKIWSQAISVFGTHRLRKKSTLTETSQEGSNTVSDVDQRKEEPTLISTYIW